MQANFLPLRMVSGRIQSKGRKNTRVQIKRNCYDVSSNNKSAEWIRRRYKMYLIWVSMYLARFIYTNWGHYFYVSWRGDRHFTWLSESRQGLAACRAKAVISFLSYFKTLSVGPASEMEPATSHSVVKRSTD